MVGKLRIGRIVVAHGVVAGLLVSLGGMLVVRRNPMFALGDLPDAMAAEMMRLDGMKSVSGSDIAIASFTMVPLLVAITWSFYRRIAALGRRRSFLGWWKVAALWFAMIFLVDLVVLDWGAYAVAKLPLLGVEDRISPAALAEFQSFGFHAREHFARPASYAALGAAPLLIACCGRLLARR